MASLLLPPASSTKTHNPQQPHCFLRSSKPNSFRFPSHSMPPKVWFSAQGVRSNRNNSTLVNAQLNELERTNVEKKDVKQVEEPPTAALAAEESISEFMAQVSNLVKLVDSRDIVELQLKQAGCELVIRKKEALPQPPSPSPDNVIMIHSPPSAAVTSSAFPPAPPASAPRPSPVSSSAQAPPPAPPAGKPKSSLPVLKCPMAGTLYRCPGPGEPPFVKVGDKVQKGQVVCIIEAMKLMNEIEADRTGTIVEVLVEDGKPVSVDLPLFVIEP